MFGITHVSSANSWRTLIAIASLSLLMAMAGCTPEPTAPTVEPQVVPPAIAKEGVLTIGVNLGSAPYATEVEQGGYAGLDVELSTELAQTLGLKPEFVQVPPDGVYEALDSASVDIVMSVPLDSGKATFVGNYTSAGSALYGAAAVEGTFTGASVGSEIVAVQQDSPAYWWFIQNRGADSVKVYSTAAEALEAVVSGEVKYAAIDSVVGAYAITAGAKVHHLGWVIPPADRTIAVRADNAELSEAITAQYAKLDGAGWIEVLVRRWLVPATVDTGGTETSATATE